MRVAFIGNCQVQTLSVAAKMMLDEPEILVFDYSQQYSRDENNRRRFAESLVNCDYIFAQTALLSFTGEKDLEPVYGKKLIKIANFYFRGLFPDSCYVGDFCHRHTDPMAVNSIIVLDAFRRHLSQEAALREFNIEAFERLGLLDGWSSSMTEMRQREANAVIDVLASDVMEEACRQYPAFLTMNHPSASLLADYLGRVFNYAGIKHRYINILSIADPLDEHDTTPILDEVAEYYRLPYRVSQYWRINSMDRRFVSRAEYIAAFYGAYQKAEPRTLLVHSPTDMVSHLNASPALAYLVDGASTVSLFGDSSRALGPRPQSLTPDVLQVHSAQVEAAISDTSAELSNCLPEIRSDSALAGRAYRRLIRLLPTVATLLQSGPTLSHSGSKQVKRRAGLLVVVVMLCAVVAAGYFAIALVRNS